MSSAEGTIPAASTPVSPRLATVMLIATTFLWGLTFPLGKDWLNAAARTGFPGGDTGSVLTQIGLRLTLSLLLLLAWRPSLAWSLSRASLLRGLTLGFLNGAGMVLQSLGLAQTSPALSVFLTSLASAWVPVIAYLVFRVTSPPLTLLGLSIGMVGVAVLGVQGNSAWVLLAGDWLTLASSVLFAIFIILIDRWGRTIPSSELTVGILAGTAFPTLLMAAGWMSSDPGLEVWLGKTASLMQEPGVLIASILLTLTPVLTYLWMARYQPGVPASRAALIYLLEPVFGTLLSLLWGHDQPTIRLGVGGALILGGNLVVELPGWLKRRRR